MGRNRDSMNRGTEVGEMADGAHSTPAIVILVLAGRPQSLPAAMATSRLVSLPQTFLQYSTSSKSKKLQH